MFMSISVMQSRLKGNLLSVCLGCQITWHMLIFVSSVVRLFNIYWKCELSGLNLNAMLIWPRVYIGGFLCDLVTFFLHIRNDGMEDKYSVLIRFDGQDSTDSFYKHFNGRHFSSLEVIILFFSLKNAHIDLKLKQRN